MSQETRDLFKIFIEAAKSVEATSPDGKPWRFSNRSDYVSRLIEAGLMASESELEGRTDLVSAIQQHWHFRGQNACKFAQMLSNDREESGWSTAVVPGGNAMVWSDAVIGEIADAVALAFKSEHVLALSLLFPGVTTIDGLANLLDTLPDALGWPTEVNKLEGPRDGLFSVEARIPIPHQEPDAYSWVVGFGPFDFLPFTRQAPFVELSFASKPKELPVRHPLLNADPSAAHLADIPVALPDATFEKFWKDTQGAKAHLLSGKDPAARARVTFAVPFNLKGRLPAV